MVIVREYKDEDVKGMIKLLTESEDTFPGGISGGIKWDEKRVQEMFKRNKSIANYIVVENNEPLGLLMLADHWREPGCGYINWLFVNPKHQGKSYGRRLLQKAVEQSTVEGHRRLDLDTWTGNMKAFPLYKKTGFYWVPDTAVYMQNYIPAIMRHPAARNFFKQHPNWYETFKRDLRVEPDHEELHKSKVYTYEWVTEKNQLKMFIDKEAFAISGFETDEFITHMSSQGQRAPTSIPYQVTWFIQNKTNNDLEMSIILLKKAGFKIIKAPPPRTIIKPKMKKTIEATIEIENSLLPKDQWEPGHILQSHLLVNGVVYPLTVGFRIQQPIEVTYDPEHLSVYPGSELELNVNLRNNLPGSINGKVVLSLPEGVSSNKPELTFKMAKNGITGVKFDLKISHQRPGYLIPIHVHAVMKWKNKQIKTRLDELFIRIIDIGSIFAHLEKNNKNIIMENERLRGIIKLDKGGQITTLTEKPSNIKIGHNLLRDSIGEPFWPNQLEFTRYHHRIYQHQRSVKVELSTRLKKRPGVELTKQIMMFAGSPLLKIRYKFSNHTSHLVETFKLLTMNHAYGTLRHINIPYTHGLVSAPVLAWGFPSDRRDLPRFPKDYQETWCAIENRDSNITFGLIWNNQYLSEARHGGFISYSLAPDLEFNIPKLKPYEKLSLPPFYIYAGPGGWHRVRALWLELMEKKVETRPKVFEDVTPLYKLGFEEEPIIIKYTPTKRMKVVLQSSRNKELSGKIKILPPKGFNFTPSEFTVGKVSLKNPYKGNTILNIPNELPMGPYNIQLNFISDQIQLKNLKTIILAGRTGKSSYEKKSEKGKPIIEIDNGRFILKASKQHYGSVYSLIEKDLKLEFFSSSFPTPRPLILINPWYGGLHFQIPRAEIYDHFGSLHKETFTTRYITRNKWQGVLSRTSINNSLPKYRGLKLEMEVLTQPDSNIFPIVTRIINPTKATLNPKIEFILFPLMGELNRKTNFILPLSQNNLAEGLVNKDNFIRPSADNWLAVTDRDRDRALVLISTGKIESQVWLISILGNGTWITADVAEYIKPLETIEKIYYLVICSSDKDEIRNYRALRRNRELPK